MNKKIYIVVGIMGFFIIGCQTTHYLRHTQNPDVDVSRYRTFSVLPPSEHFSNLEPNLLIQLINTVTNTVTTLLEEKGYRPSQLAFADFVVYVRGKLIPPRDITELGYIPEFGRIGWAKSYPYQYGYTIQDQTTFKENILVVEIYDNTIRKLVWVGWATLPDKIPEDKKGMEIVQGLMRILSNFPACTSQN